MQELKKSIGRILENLQKEGVDCFRDRNTGDIYLIRGTKIVKYIELDKIIKQCVAEMQ